MDSDAIAYGAARPVDEFVARVEHLTDAERLAVAEARKAVHEDYHEGALRAAAELLVGRGEAYAAARVRVAGAHLPEALEHDGERERWAEVSRLVQLAIDEAIVGLLVSDLLHPNHVRELYRPWWALPASGRS